MKHPPRGGCAASVEARQFVLRDEHGRVLANLPEVPNGSAGLALYDDRAKLLALLSVAPDGSRTLGLLAWHGTPRLVTGTDAAGGAGLVALDNAGEQRIRL